MLLTICFCGGGLNFEGQILGGIFWKKIFGVKKFGRGDNFFLGGGQKISGGGGGVKFVLNIQFLWRNLWLQKVFIILKFEWFY